MSHKILLLHATHLAMAPIHNAFADLWPEAILINILDDGLSLDRSNEDGEISESMIERFVRFGHHGYDSSVSGILVTCSAFGAAIDRLAETVSVPVLKPNEAMFRAAIAHGQRIGMLATFGAAIHPMTEEFKEFSRYMESSAQLRTVLVDGAMAHLQAGDEEFHNKLVAERAVEFADCDAIMLAQFSTASAAASVRAVTDIPVFTAPQAAVERMQKLVKGM